MSKRERRFHYAWVIFACCILLKIGLGGSIMAIAVNFATPVVRELGCGVSQFTMLVSVEAAAMAVLYTTAAKVLNRYRPGLVMGVAALAEVVGIALMANYHSVYMFYLSGAIIGVGVAFTGFVAIPIVINMWFKKRAGTVLGVVVAAEGISAVVYNLLTAQFIVRFGWRSAYLILATVSLVLSVPGLFLFVKRPEEMGVQPYGSEASDASGETVSEDWGISRSHAVRLPLFYAIWLTCMLYSVGCGVQQYIANFATMELGCSIPYGATAATCMSLGCVLSSVILGYINDRFSVKAGLAWGAAFIGLGYGGMLLSISSHGLVIPSALLVGLGGSMYTVQCPLLVRSTLGSRHYSSIWALMMTGNSLIGALSFSSIGLFYDKGGSYKGAFIMAIVLYFSALVLGSVAIDRSKRHKRSTEMGEQA